MRSFLWDEYADWYIEVSKRRIAGGDPVAAAQARRALVPRSGGRGTERGALVYLALLTLTLTLLSLTLTLLSLIIALLSLTLTLLTLTLTLLALTLTLLALTHPHPA